jgi:hypothetical protein
MYPTTWDLHAKLMKLRSTVKVAQASKNFKRVLEKPEHGQPPGSMTEIAQVWQAKGTCGCVEN